jgi:hypothetical protein
MQMPGTENPLVEKRRSPLRSALGLLLIPALLVGAVLSIPCIYALRWIRQLEEYRFRRQIRSRGRSMAWTEFLRTMHGAGGTCIEERFSPKGPVRYWWTPENVSHESPHEIIDWFTMRKGGRSEPFIRWCRQRYTSADQGSAILVETMGVPSREIYSIWAECRTGTWASRWVEVAPPEILARRPGE